MLYNLTYAYLCQMSLLKEKNIRTTSVSEIGEFKLIDQVTKSFISKNKNTIFAIGDDAAVLKVDKNRLQLLSSDMLVEGIHFDLSYTPLKHLGYKSVIVNASDIYAMNGMPKQIMISIAVSNRFSVESIEELYSGIQLACEKYNIDLIGGDTTSSQSGMVISLTVIGEVNKNNISYRKGANKNDLLVVTGDLGASYLGLQILKREKKIFLENPEIQPDLQGHDYPIGRQLKPDSKEDIIKKFQKLNIVPTSMIDISDGLSSEILHISKSSNVGVTIYEDKIPLDPTTISLASDLNLNPVICALSGGEDYELLFTIDQDNYETINQDPDFSIIGHITDISEGNNFVDNKSSSHPITAQGWDSF